MKIANIVHYNHIDPPNNLKKHNILQLHFEMQIQKYMNFIFNRKTMRCLIQDNSALLKEHVHDRSMNKPYSDKKPTYARYHIKYKCKSVYSMLNGFQDLLFLTCILK